MQAILPCQKWSKLSPTTCWWSPWRRTNDGDAWITCRDENTLTNLECNIKLIQQWYFLWDVHFRQVSHTTNIQCPRWFPLHHGATGDSCRRSHGQSAKGRTSGAQICSSSSYCGTSSFEPLDQKGMGLWNVRKLGRWIFQRICFIVMNCIELCWIVFIFHFIW